jgi:hypothetical protein
MYVLAKGFKRAIEATTTAVLEFITGDGARVRTPPKPIPTGQLIVRLDSDNDTKMASDGSLEDDEDDAAARAGKAFVFWGRDPVLKDEDALVDYARVSLRRRTEVSPDARVALRLRGCEWDAHRRITLSGDFGGQLPVGCEEDGKLQFCQPFAARRQVDLIKTSDPRIRFSGEGDRREVPSLLLRLHESVEAVFRVTAGCGAATMEVGEVLADGSFEPLNEAKIEVRAFRDLASMVSLRGSVDPPATPQWTHPHYQVAPEAQEVPGWSSLAGTLATAKHITLFVHGYAVTHREFSRGTTSTPSDFETVAKRLYWAGHPILEAQDFSRIVGVSWPGDLPGDINPFVARLLRTDWIRPYFQEDEFNAFLAGVPLGKLLGQLRSGPEGRKVGVLAHSLGNVVMNSALQRLPAGGGAAPLNYLMVQAAVPSEAFLQDYDPLAARQTIPGVADLVRHAQRLGFPNPEAGQPLPDMIWLDQENEVFQKLGQFAPPYKCDMADQLPAFVPLECFDPEIPPSLPAGACNAERCEITTKFYRGFNAVDPALSPLPTNFNGMPVHPSFFNTRWSKLGRNLNQTLQGPWTGLFVSHVDPETAPAGIRIFNAYNPGDFVLRIDRDYHELRPLLQALAESGLPAFFVSAFDSRNIHAWKALQILSKPFSPSFEAAEARLRDAFRLGGANDPLDRQKWWTLEVDGRPSAWQSTAQTPAWVTALVGNDKAWIRRRAEIALWYPALSPPAGVVPLSDLSQAIVGDTGGLPTQGRNIDMSSVGGDRGPDATGTASHTYITMRKLHDVWRGYRAFRTVFAQ